MKFLLPLFALFTFGCSEDKPEPESSHLSGEMTKSDSALADEVAQELEDVYDEDFSDMNFGDDDESVWEEDTSEIFLAE